MQYVTLKKVSGLGKALLKVLTKLKLSSEESAKINYEGYQYPYPIVQKILHAVYIIAKVNKNKYCCYFFNERRI